MTFPSVNPSISPWLDLNQRESWDPNERAVVEMMELNDDCSVADIIVMMILRNEASFRQLSHVGHNEELENSWLAMSDD